MCWNARSVLYSLFRLMSLYMLRYLSVKDYAMYMFVLRLYKSIVAMWNVQKTCHSMTMVNSYQIEEDIEKFLGNIFLQF